MTPWILAMVGCEGLMTPEPEPEPEVPEQCRNIHVDKLAIDWISVKGQAADAKVRMRVEEKGGGYLVYYIDGSFVRRTMKGVKRDKDVQLTEMPDAKKKAMVAKGEAELVRIYVEPSLKDCALKAFIGKVDGKDKESIPPTATEFVPFPDQGVTFSYKPADEPLFLGEAASKPKVRAKQVEELGGPKPDTEMGTVPVGTWTKVDDDGDPSCTYDMDLYFDDQLDTALSPKTAGEPEDGKRHWFHEWEAPFSGNHHFEFYRYRTCGDGKRELIAVAGVDAILM